MYINTLEDKCFVNPKYFTDDNADMFLPHISEFSDRILKICEKYKIYKAEDLSINTGLDFNICEDIFKMKYKPTKQIIDVIKQSFFDVNGEWIETGRGRMFYADYNKEPEVVNEPKPDYGNKVIIDLVDVIKQLTDTNQKHADNISELIKKLK